MQPLEKQLPIEEEHPSVEELVGLLRGELPRDAAKAIVRHLLTNCPRCQQLTRRYWQLAELQLPLEKLKQEAAALTAEAARHKNRPGAPRRRPRRRSGMTLIEATRDRLRKIVRALEEVVSELQEVQASLPEPDLDLDRLEEETEEDIEAEIRAVIGCVLTDSIGPAIRDLRDAAAYGAQEETDAEAGPPREDPEEGPD